jgi:hypothetical protein
MEFWINIIQLYLLNHLSHLNVQTHLRVVKTLSCVVPISRGSFNFQPTLLCFSIDFSSIAHDSRNILHCRSLWHQWVVHVFTQKKRWRQHLRENVFYVILTSLDAILVLLYVCRSRDVYISVK